MEERTSDEGSPLEHRPACGLPADTGAEDIAREFPGWEAWRGMNSLWHARIRGAIPPVMVHGEDPVDLRDQILAYQYRSR